jgi:hypothetical protein
MAALFFDQIDQVAAVDLENGFVIGSAQILPDRVPLKFRDFEQLMYPVYGIPAFRYVRHVCVGSTFVFKDIGYLACVTYICTTTYRVPVPVPVCFICFDTLRSGS